MDKSRLDTADPVSESNTSVAVLIEPVAESATRSNLVPPPVRAGDQPHGAEGAACPNCQAPLANGQTLCRKCGFYATLNTFVEVEPDSAANAAEASAEPKSHLQVWKSVIPPWGWGLIGGVLVLLVISFVGRFFAPSQSSRAIWTYAQFAIGVIALIVAHVLCYLFAIMLDSTLNVLDIVLKPVAVWTPSIHDLPKSFKRVALGTWGLSAAVFAALVVGGVRYDEIIDWGKVPPKKKKKPAVSVPIDSQDTDKSMEEALDEFTNNAGVTAQNGDDSKLDKGNRQKMARCLIIGFTPHRESDFDSLILAIEEDGKWRYAGVVNEGIPVEVRSTLNRRMRTSLRSKPVIPCELNGFWVNPKLMCTVWYEDWTEEGRFKRPFFDKVQPDFQPPQRRPKTE
jgi:hypothetical protein